VLPFVPLAVDPEGSSEAGFVFAAAVTEVVEFEAAGTETSETGVAKLEVVEGAEEVMTDLDEGRTVLLMSA
jgi:hypothetical protein